MKKEQIEELAAALGYCLVPSIEVLRKQCELAGYVMITTDELFDRQSQSYEAGQNAAFAEGFECGIDSIHNKIIRTETYWTHGSYMRSSFPKWDTTDLEDGVGPAFWDRKGNYYARMDIDQILEQTREQIPDRDLYTPGLIPGGPTTIEELDVYDVYKEETR